jgi:hypothetical protein
MTLQELVDGFIESRATGGLSLDPAEVLGQAVRAARKFAAYSRFTTPPDGWTATSRPLSSINEGLSLTASEWGVIEPLFVAYTDHENALRLEATRGLGLDVFGRSASEIAQQIETLERELPKAAFSAKPVSIGLPDEEV